MDGKETTPVNSPVGSDENLSPRGSFSRLRIPFRRGSGKGLKQKLQTAQQENADLQKRLDNAVQEISTLRRRIEEVVTSNRFYVGNIQIGDNCSMTTEASNDSIDDTLQEVEGLIAKLTDALEKDVKVRAELKMENDNTKIQLLEMKQMISDQYQKWQKRAEDDTRAIDDFKTLLVDSQANRSDEELLSACILALKSTQQQRIVGDFKSLPVKAQPGIIRLVNKFGKMKWREFAKTIGLDQCTINLGCDSSDEGLPVSDILKEDVCSVIVAEWTKLEDNSPDRFLVQIKVIERRILADLKKECEKAVICNDTGNRQYRDHFPRLSSTESIVTTVVTRRERTRSADSQSVDEQLKQMKRATDTLKGFSRDIALLGDMKVKIDALYERLPQEKLRESNSIKATDSMNQCMYESKQI